MAGKSLAEILAAGRQGPLQAQQAIEQIAKRMRGRPVTRSAEAREGRAQMPLMPRHEWPVAVPYPTPDRWIVLQGVTGVGPGTTSGGYRLEFAQGAGIVLGWNGCAQSTSDQNLARSSLKVRVAWNGEEEIITNGQAADFVHFSNALKGDAFPYTPLMVHVTREDKATVYFGNDHTLNTYTPAVAFAFWDLERRDRRRSK